MMKWIEISNNDEFSRNNGNGRQKRNKTLTVNWVDKSDNELERKK